MSAYTVKNCFTGVTVYIITLGHKLVTLGLLIANRQLAYVVQVTMEKTDFVQF